MTKHNSNAFAKTRLAAIVLFVLAHFGIAVYANLGKKRG